jgi:hypothetical protein
MFARWTSVVLFLSLVGQNRAAEPDLSSPHATFRTFLEAVKKNDLEQAKRCWTIDDDNRSGALDVLVGRWIAARKLSDIVDAKLGANGLKVMGRWHRADLSNQAIGRTIVRLEKAEAVDREDIATLKFRWEPGDSADGKQTAVFLYLNVPYGLHKIGNQWRIDANLFMDVKQADELFKPNSIWVVWREEMELMNRLTEMLEKRQIQTVAQFEKQVKESVDALKAKYAKKP